MNKKEYILKLHEIGAIQFGSFTLKSGIQSPFYIDLRRLISFPEFLQATTDLLWQQLKKRTYHYDYICGVPYTALPFAILLSVQHNIPMIMRRKEVKTHGTQRTIEGVYEQGKNCLVIEDLFTSGSSTLETIALLEQEGLVVKEVIIVIDREQGGMANITKRGYIVHHLFTLSYILCVLHDAHVIDKECVYGIDNFIKQQQISI